METNYNIYVVDDNVFFNKILSKSIKDFMEEYTRDKAFKFELNSFVNPNDLLLNLKKENLIIFLDYYLGNYQIGPDIITNIYKQTNNFSLAMISRFENYRTSDIPFNMGASAFLKKDKDIFEKACFFIEETITK